VINADLQDLVDSPREDLGVELKGWVDLADSKTKASMARHICALANFGGGYIVFGFRDDCTADPNIPEDLSPYSRDIFGGIVKRYLSPNFQCDVTEVIATKTGTKHVVVRVPSHGNVPVCAIASGPHDAKGKPQGIEQYVHYSRASGPESTPVSNAEQWRPIIHRCVVHERQMLLDSLSAILKGPQSESEVKTERATRGPQTPPVDESSKAFADWQRGNHSTYVVKAQNAQRTKKQEWPVSIEDNHYQLSYRIVQSEASEIQAEEFIKALKQANNTVRATVWTGWSMFYVFEKPDIGLRVLPQFIGGEDTDVYECDHLGHHTDTTTILPDYWLATRRGWATLMRPYREDRLPTATVGGHQLRSGSWLSGFLLVRELTELMAHASAMLAHFPQAHVVEFECHWYGLKDRALYDQFSDSLGATCETSSRSARATASAAGLAQSWPHTVSALANRIFILFGQKTVSPEWVEAASPQFRMSWIPQPES
jgi:hypothetical protein